MWRCGLDKQRSNFAEICGTFGETCVCLTQFPYVTTASTDRSWENAMMKEIYNLDE